MGRFIARDPVGYTAGTNVYEYVDDSPISATDPSGNVIVFQDRPAADAFADELKGLGAKYVTIAEVENSTETTRRFPTVYVTTDPRDMQALFAYANKHFEVYKRFKNRDTCDFDKLPQHLQDLVSRRNQFLLAAGVAGATGYAVDIEGSNNTGFIKAGIGKAMTAQRASQNGAKPAVAIDIGGEGHHEGAINVNINVHGTFGDTGGKDIPNLMLRPGCAGELPFVAGGVNTVYMERTKISAETAKEIARVAGAGGTVSLLGYSNFSEAEFQGVLDAFAALGKKTTMERTTQNDPNGLPELIWTITVGTESRWPVVQNKTEYRSERA